MAPRRATAPAKAGKAAPAKSRARVPAKGSSSANAGTRIGQATASGAARAVQPQEKALPSRSPSKRRGTARRTPSSPTPVDSQPQGAVAKGQGKRPRPGGSMDPLHTGGPGVSGAVPPPRPSINDDALQVLRQLSEQHDGVMLPRLSLRSKVGVCLGGTTLGLGRGMLLLLQGQVWVHLHLHGRGRDPSTASLHSIVGLIASRPVSLPAVAQPCRKSG